MSLKTLEKKLKSSQEELDTLRAFLAVELGQMKSQIAQLENVAVATLRIAGYDINELTDELLDVERNNHYRDIIQIKINDKANKRG